MLFCPVKLTCGGTSALVQQSLLDSGAGICHMTYRLWTFMGIHELLWKDNPKLCKQMGINAPYQMSFDTLPLASTVSMLGDGREVKVYEFRLSALELGLPSLAFPHSIPFKNINVRLINREDSAFIVGWNILKYLQHTYHPSPSNLIYELELTEAGKQLFENDRKNKVANDMQSMFKYQVSVG